jgi:hypothetical protein
VPRPDRCTGPGRARCRAHHDQKGAPGSTTYSLRSPSGSATCIRFPDCSARSGWATRMSPTGRSHMPTRACRAAIPRWWIARPTFRQLWVWAHRTLDGPRGVCRPTTTREERYPHPPPPSIFFLGNFFYFYFWVIFTTYHQYHNESHRRTGPYTISTLSTYTTTTPPTPGSHHHLPHTTTHHDIPLHPLHTGQ